MGVIEHVKWGKRSNIYGRKVVCKGMVGWEDCRSQTSSKATDRRVMYAIRFDRGGADASPTRAASWPAKAPPDELAAVVAIALVVVDTLASAVVPTRLPAADVATALVVADTLPSAVVPTRLLVAETVVALLFVDRVVMLLVVDHAVSLLEVNELSSVCGVDRRQTPSAAFPPHICDRETGESGPVAKKEARPGRGDTRTEFGLPEHA